MLVKQPLTNLFNDLIGKFSSCFYLSSNVRPSNKGFVWTQTYNIAKRYQKHKKNQRVWYKNLARKISVSPYFLYILLVQNGGNLLTKLKL